MFCEICGVRLKEGAKFCTNCGAPVAQNEAEEHPAPSHAEKQPVPSNPEELSARIQLCPDGKYRWSYEVNLWKNPSILLDLMKVFGIIMAGIWFLSVILVPLFDGHLRWHRVVDASTVYIWVIVAMLALCLVGYVISGIISGGRYAAFFVMDEETVTHQQMGKGVKRTQLIAAINMMMDSDSGAAALLVAAQSPFITPFKKVRKIKALRRRHLIKVDELLTKNRIYVEDPEDYEFVLDYISKRCPKARKR